MQEKHPELFAKLDANNDQVLSKDELKAGRELRQANKANKAAKREK